VSLFELHNLLDGLELAAFARARALTAGGNVFRDEFLGAVDGAAFKAREISLLETFQPPRQPAATIARICDSINKAVLEYSCFVRQSMENRSDLSAARGLDFIPAGNCPEKSEQAY